MNTPSTAAVALMQLCDGPIVTVTRGVIVSAPPSLPGNALAAAIGAAMGRAMSSATVNDDLATTLTMRKQVLEAFERELKNFVPAIQGMTKQ